MLRSSQPTAERIAVPLGECGTGDSHKEPLPKRAENDENALGKPGRHQQMFGKMNMTSANSIGFYVDFRSLFKLSCTA